MCTTCTCILQNNVHVHCHYVSHKLLCIGKAHYKSLEKEIELLKQQLQGKIKTGQTFITSDNTSATSFRLDSKQEMQEKRKEKDKKGPQDKQDKLWSLLSPEKEKEGIADDIDSEPEKSKHIEIVELSPDNKENIKKNIDDALDSKQKKQLGDVEAAPFSPDDKENSKRDDTSDTCFGLDSEQEKPANVKVSQLNCIDTCISTSCTYA